MEMRHTSSFQACHRIPFSPKQPVAVVEFSSDVGWIKNGKKNGSMKLSKIDSNRLDLLDEKEGQL
ncbi:MAG TPA: hypothetical protein VJH55_04230 [Candidatus Paceibacterota bacterium]